jgi:hypothetical protein
MSLKIVPIETKATEIRSPPLMEQINLKHPFSLFLCGNTGSGKSVLAMNLLKQPQMYGKYFDQIYLFSITGKADDTFKCLNLKKSNIITDNMIQKLDKIMKTQLEKVEQKGIEKAPKICILFEDLTANKKLMNSKSFLQAFVQNRHLSLSTIAAGHKFKSLIRTARLNSNHVMIFPCTEGEVKQIVDDYQPPSLNKKEFIQLIQYSFEPTNDNLYPFLWVNRKEKNSKTFFRKSLSELLEIQ